MTEPVTRKFNAFTNIGNIQNGDVLLGERTDGTTVRITYQSFASDGDKGDITISSNGTVWTIDTPTVATVATDDKVLIKDTSASDATKYVTAQSIADLAGVTDGDKGDITVSGSGTVWTVDNDAITYAKMQNVSATDTLLGRSTAGSGDVEEITCTAAGRAILDDLDAAAQRSTLGLGTLATQNGTFSGTSSGTNTGDQTITLTGDVTGSGTGSFAATIANAAVTYAKIQDVSATARILGRNTAGAGSIEELTATTVKTMLSLNNVENTALSTWAGSTALVTLGTITTGTWNGTTISVANGGTGKTSVTAYAPLVGGTTSTGAFQSTASGSTGQILQSAGNAAVPTWSTPTYPSASGTSRKILVSDGTNNVYSTETYAVPGSAGNLLRSDGTNWTAAKATLTTDVTGVLPVANGGTGIASATAYGVICGGTTTTGAFQSLSTGTAGQWLISGGSSALPAFGVPNSCIVVHSTNQTINNTTVTTLNFDTELADNGGLHDTVTNNSRITIGQTGVYLVFTYVYWTGGTADTGVLQNLIYVNGSNTSSVTISAATTTGDDVNLYGIPMQLTAGDYVELKVWQNSGASRTVACNGTAATSSLSLFRVA